MIFPPRDSPCGPPIMAFVATAWVMSHVPSTFSRITVRKPFGVMSSAGLMYWPPALFTSTSMRPWRRGAAPRRARGPRRMRAARSSEVLAVEAERDVVRRLGARELLERAGVEHE